MTPKFMAQGRIIKPHVASYDNPLKAKAGESFLITDKKSEWPGWIWCISGDGQAAWLPTAWLAIEGGQARLERDYDSAELSVREGEMVEIIEEEAGWLWCKSEEGASGWIPAAAIARLE